VLVHRRLLAAVLALVAVAAGVHAARPPASPAASLSVARRDLPAGTVLTPADLTTIAVPPGAVPAGAQRNAAGRTLAASLRRGEPITDLRLVGPGLTVGHPELVAVPVRLPDAGMAALLHVGDRIRLLATDPQTGVATTVSADALVLALPAGDAAPTSDHTSDQASGPASGQIAAATGTSGRLVVLGVPDDLVTEVTSAAVTRFLTYAYPH
jgi:Flp pilus assembly protein CpaB